DDCARALPATFPALKFFRQSWIAEVVLEQVNYPNPQTVLYFELAEIAQVRLPMPVSREVVGDMFGKKNVVGVAAIHHPLRNVDPGTGDVHCVIHVTDLINRPAVNSHSQTEARRFL